MKQLKIAFILFFSIFKLVYGQENNMHFSIEGSTNAVSEGFISMKDRQGKSILDSIPIKDHKFHLESTLPKLAEYIFIIQPGKWDALSIVEVGNITMFIDTSLHSVMGRDGDAYKMIPFVGAKGTPILNVYSKLQADIAMKAAIEQIFKLKTQTDPDQKTIDSIVTSTQSAYYSWVRDFIENHRDNVANAYLLYLTESLGLNFDLGDYDRLVHLIYGAGTKNIYYTYAIDKLKKWKESSPGSSYLDFTAKDNHNHTYTLSKSKAKYILLDFWASWCAPCREAIPEMKKIYGDYHSKGFDIVSITNDISKKDWLSALSKEKMPWDQIWDYIDSTKSHPIISIYPSKGIPHLVLIDNINKQILLSTSDIDVVRKALISLIQ